MSSTETLPKNTTPTERHDSLSSGKNAEAVQLYKGYMKAQRNRYEGRNNRKYHPTYTSGIFQPFDAAIEIGKVHSSLGRAKRHYEENKDAYHSQAVKDAAKEEVEVNFSGDVAKGVEYSREN